MFSNSSADGLLDPMSIFARYTCTESAEMTCPRMMVELSVLLLVVFPLTTQVLCQDDVVAAVDVVVVVVDDDGEWQ